MRGKLPLDCVPAVVERITPACAGKTTVKNVLKPFTQDHPRVCGENLSTIFCSSFCGGSPPRVRGKLYNGRVVTLRARITPACAGKTSRFPLLYISNRDHPRVCGENLLSHTFSETLPGSPPRVRGKRGYMDPDPHRVGITPACAGKTHPKSY